MLKFFPTPYPDEILYSVLARYHVRSGNMNASTTARELFSSIRSSQSLIMPHNLDVLVGNMPENSEYTAEELIFKNTMFPFYAAFLEKETADRIFAAMKLSYNFKIYCAAGIMASAIQSPEYIRFCPTCIVEDKIKYGEMYWHRIHQVPGVFICPVHHEILLNSKIFIRSPYREYYPANEQSCQIYKPNVQYSSDTFEKLKNLAKDVVWLFENCLLLGDRHIIVRKYINRLIEKGLATVTGQVRCNVLCTSIKEYYGDKFLQSIQCGILNCHSENWIRNIARDQAASTHPIRHVLLIRYLSGSPQCFLENNDEYKPFGNGPWPCLNKIAEHYLDPVIENVRIQAHHGNKRPVGTFTCSCGFVYSRHGPDEEKDRYRIGRIKNYGHMWERKLRQCLEEEKLSLTQTAKVQKTSINTVKKYAAILGIDITSPYMKSNYFVANTLKKSSNNDVYRTQRTQQCRQLWKQLQDENKTANRHQLSKIDHATYSWLKHNDREWYEHNSPPPGFNKSASRKVNWGNRDEEILEKVRNVVNDILNSENKPERITIFSVSKKAVLSTILYYRLNMLPKTKQYLIPLLESIDDFQIKRIKWAAKYVYGQNRKVSKNNILKAAGLQTEKATHFEEIIKSEINKYIT